MLLLRGATAAHLKSSAGVMRGEKAGKVGRKHAADAEGAAQEALRAAAGEQAREAQRSSPGPAEEQFKLQAVGRLRRGAALGREMAAVVMKVVAAAAPAGRRGARAARSSTAKPRRRADIAGCA